jgi:O-methyltransferase involved in polyketide biosynthesis
LQRSRLSPRRIAISMPGLISAPSSGSLMRCVAMVLSPGLRALDRSSPCRWNFDNQCIPDGMIHVPASPLASHLQQTMSRSSASISPTAHYTGYTWFSHGLSHPALVTPQGRLLHGALLPMHALAKAVGAPTLSAFLLARHRIIDHLLDRAIEEGRVEQIVEVAAGLSPRGWRFKQRYGSRVRYVEADLPDMSQRKLKLLQDAKLLTPGHEVVALDALADGGALSLAALADRLDKRKGTAIVTEGLLNYFDTSTVLGMWSRFGQVLARFPHGMYLSDIHLSEIRQDASGVDTFMATLSTFVRGRVFLHFDNSVVATTALHDAGFPSAELHAPRDLAASLNLKLQPGANLVRVIEARVDLATGSGS